MAVAELCGLGKSRQNRLPGQPAGGCSQSPSSCLCRCEIVLRHHGRHGASAASRAVWATKQGPDACTRTQLEEVSRASLQPCVTASSRGVLLRASRLSSACGAAAVRNVAGAKWFAPVRRRPAMPLLVGQQRTSRLASPRAAERRNSVMRVALTLSTERSAIQRNAPSIARSRTGMPGASARSPVVVASARELVR